MAKKKDTDLFGLDRYGNPPLPTLDRRDSERPTLYVPPMTFNRNKTAHKVAFGFVAVGFLVWLGSNLFDAVIRDGR